MTDSMRSAGAGETPASMPCGQPETPVESAGLATATDAEEPFEVIGPSTFACWALEVPWRTGRKIRRTVYAMVSAAPSDDDALIGLMDYPAVAEAIVIEHNRSLRDA